ncbi:MAG: hypothetical protein R2741_05050 [Methanolobus sp.]
MNYKKTVKAASTLFLIIALVSAVFVSGCADQAEEQDGEQTGEQAEEITDLTFGYQPSTHQIAYITAEKKWMVD